MAAECPHYLYYQKKPIFYFYVLGKEAEYVKKGNDFNLRIYLNDAVQQEPIQSRGRSASRGGNAKQARSKSARKPAQDMVYKPKNRFEHFAKD